MRFSSRLLCCFKSCFQSNRIASSRVIICLCLGGLLCIASHSFADEAGIEYFEKSVRPVLVEHCQECHGAKKQEAGLRLDLRHGLIKGGDSGPAIVPSKPDESLLIEAVRYAGDTQMPPEAKLTQKQIDDLVNWVKIGAPWPATDKVPGEDTAKKQRQHWAFQPIANPAPPEVQDKGWINTPIDRFILAKLEEQKLHPASPADKRTLIRRVTYDLTGLPPTAEQVAAFVSDTDPAAYEKLVERLLAAPQYGEQWGRHWLDVARYSDTKGYVYAREERFWVHAPAYRDWVVNAFNRDLPYDQFLLLQIAADQVAPDAPKDLAAMGFLTLGRRFLGVTHDIIDDRIDVVSRGTMGLTVACARCHDHKYDPIPTADYYSLYGIFQNSHEQLTQIADSPRAEEAEYEAFAKELEARQKKLAETMLSKRKEAEERVRSRIDEYLIAQTELEKYPQEGFDQVLATSDVIPTFVQRWQAWLALEQRKTDPVFLSWKRFETFDDETFSKQAAAFLSELNARPETVNPFVLKMLSPPPESMREVARRYGQLLKEVNQQWQKAIESAKTDQRPQPEKLENPEAEELRQVLYGFGSPCLVPDEPIVANELFFDSGTMTELWKLQGEVDRWLIQSPLSPPHALAMVDRELIRPARILRRGDPAKPGPKVERHFVSVVAGEDPVPFQQGSGRLELAEAIVDPTNPLTARVWVNRVWQHHFGAGLVRTASDFGLRADSPSHPQLLDWLATRFVADGWSTKKLHRLILLSRTYRQSSRGKTDTAQRERLKSIDPENRLLSRMNPHRLTFEEFRDTLLSVSGRLDPEMGGRAADLFAENGTTHRRRTLYGLIDRQFLATTLRVFDFASPDLHTPVRSETTVPQQALFALNHPFVAQQAEALVERLKKDENVDAADLVRELYQAFYQREPTSEQVAAALGFLNSNVEVANPKPRPETLAWKYGYGEVDESTKQLKNFQELPHFTGSAWQGSAQWPDPKLGWVQLTAQGGHPGNDMRHCSIRRWVAPHDGTFSVTSTPVHEVAVGNGIRCWIFSSSGGLLASVELHNERKELNLDSIAMKKGDSLDFVVDHNNNLNSDQNLWGVTITPVDDVAQQDAVVTTQWNSERDFSAPIPDYLDPWEQLAQVLLISNELMFVD